MLDALLTRWLRWLGGPPCFQIYGRARTEPAWRIVDVYATTRRNSGSGWPLCQGTCITWTSRIIVVGWDFADDLLHEQVDAPASREHPVRVAGGRISSLRAREAAGSSSFASAAEILAHECGHTWQVLRLRDAYLPLVGSVTLFGEGRHFWNHFENQASEIGQFGGLVNGSVCAELMARIRAGDLPR
jgi:hypothetical protein